MTINLQNVRLTDVLNFTTTDDIYIHDSDINKAYLKGFLFHNLSTYAEIKILFNASQIMYLPLNEKDTVTFEFPYPLIFQYDTDTISLEIPVGDSPNINIILFGEKTTA